MIKQLKTWENFEEDEWLEYTKREDRIFFNVMCADERRHKSLWEY